MAAFEPCLHVGEPVLEGLIRGQGTTERVTVERPFNRHVKASLHGPDRLGCTHHQRGKQLPLDCVVAPPRSPTKLERGPGCWQTGRSENRRVRSTDCIGVIVIPAVATGTSTLGQAAAWLARSPARRRQRSPIQAAGPADQHEFVSVNPHRDPAGSFRRRSVALRIALRSWNLPKFRRPHQAWIQRH